MFVFESSLALLKKDPFTLRVSLGNDKFFLSHWFLSPVNLFSSVNFTDEFRGPLYAVFYLRVPLSHLVAPPPSFSCFYTLRPITVLPILLACDFSF